MRRSREDTIETRARIVAIASQLFRARGIQATGVADVMSAAGMTVGGFYRHFDSKEALVAEAIESASRETTAGHLTRPERGEVDLLPLLDRYLSDAHRRDLGRGCPVAALCSEVAHEGRATKKAFTRALERLLSTVGAATSGGSRGRQDVLFAACAAVGAVVLARATHDEGLARELLSAAHEGLRDGPGVPAGRGRSPSDGN